MTTTNIKALVFDVFGTVVDWRNSIAREAATVLAPYGHDLDWHGFADAWRGKYQPAMERVRSGNRGFVRLDVLHRENLIEILTETGISDLTNTEIDVLNKAWHRLDPWPDSVAGLTRIKTRFIIAAMSNGNVSLMVNMAKFAGLPWDMILGAEPAQAYKPMPETYLTGVHWLDLEPENVLMCAAHNSDLAAASGCGLSTAFIARPQEYGPNQTSDCEPEHSFDFVTTSILDLADQLKC